MSTCPNCGEHICDRPAEPAEEAAAVAETAELTDASVKIAEIEADRDIKLARISAGVAEVVADSRADAAEAKADALESVLTPPVEPDSAPVVVVNDPAEPEPEAAPEDLPEPEPEHHERAAKKSNSWWFS